MDNNNKCGTFVGATSPRCWHKFHGGLLWGMGRALLSLKIIVRVQEWVL